MFHTIFNAQYKKPRNDTLIKLSMNELQVMLSNSNYLLVFKLLSRFILMPCMIYRKNISRIMYKVHLFSYYDLVIYQTGLLTTKIITMTSVAEYLKMVYDPCSSIVVNGKIRIKEGK